MSAAGEHGEHERLTTSLRGATLLSRIIKCNYNWKFPFLRPTIEEVVDERYSAKWPGGSKAGAAASAAAAVASENGW